MAGVHGDPLYAVWATMHQRCSNPNSRSYKTYGANGIKVCKRWKFFTLFKADMGTRPEGHWLERIDSSKGYRPSNCRWATPKEQQRNRTNNALWTHDGVTMCVKAWAEMLGVNHQTLWQRHSAYGWSIEKTLTTPVRPRSKKG